MSYRRLVPSLVFLALTTAAGPADAGEPWDGSPLAGDPAAIARAAAAVPAPPGTDVVVLLSEGRYRFDARGRAPVRTRLVYKVVTAAGATSWGTVSQDWAPWSESQPTLDARVITPDGAAHRLDPSTVTASPPTGSPRMQSERRTVSAPLPGLVPGAVVEEVRTTVEHRPQFAAGAARTFWFRATIPVHRTRLILDAPTRLKLRWKADGLSFKPTRRTRGGRVVVTFETDGLRTPVDREDWLPPRLDTGGRVTFATGRSWNRVARSYAALVDRQIAAGPPPPVAVPAGASRDDAIAAILAALRRQVRGTELALSEASPEPWTPAATWKRGYGSSNDLATLLVAMLRAANIDARVALVDRGYDADVPDLPGIGVFDTALVYVPGPRPLWIQPTARDARAGELTLSAQDRRALVAGPRTTHLINTPAPTARTNRYHEVREIHLSDYGKARVVETSRFTGRPERSYRDDYRTSKPAKLTEQLSSYVADQYGGTMASYRSSKPDDLAKPFELTLEIADAEDLETSLDSATLYLRTGPTLDRLPGLLRDDDRQKEADRRTGPYRIIEPYTYELVYRVHLPDGWRVKKLPPGRTAELGPIRIATTFQQQGTLVIGRVVTTQPARELSADDLRSLRGELQRYLASPAAKLELEHAGLADVAAGEALRGLATLRRLIAAEPKRGIPRSRLATVLVQLGLQRAALVEMKRAVAVAPTAVSYGMLGWTHDHDEIGRIYGPGWNRAAAIAAYRKSLTLDPDNDWVRGNLALSLLRDADGVPYAGDLGPAIAEMLELRKRKVDDYDDELMTALVHAGRFAELRDLAREMKPSESRNQHLIAAIAAIDGPAAARSESAQLAPGKLERSNVMTEAADKLSKARHYRAALALMREAHSIGVNPALQTAIDYLGKVERYPGRLGKRDDPVRIARLAMATMVGAAGGDAGHDKLRSKRARALGDDPIFDGGARTVRAMFRTRGMLPAMGADTVITVATYAAKTNRWGAQITTTLPTRPSTRTYARPHRGGYQLVSAFGWVPPMAAEALALARRGDRRGAETWLTWAAQELDAGNTQSLWDSGRAFRALWKHRRADRTDDLERAAAALLAMAHPKRAIAILGNCKTGAPLLDEACWDALFHAALAAADVPVMNRAMAGWRKAAPAEDRFWETFAARRAAGKWTAAEQDLRARLAKQPNDDRAERSLVDIQCEASPDPSCIDALAALAAKTGTAQAHNQLAWQALLFDRHGDAMIEAARKAVDLSNGGSPALNTLAAVQAARGELTDARATLLRVFDTLGGRVRPADWLVHGKIAATAGYPDVARAAFRRVDKPRYPSSFDEYALMLHWRGQL